MIIPLIILIMAIVCAIFNFIEWRKIRREKEMEFDGGVSRHMLNLLVIFMIFISFLMMVVEGVKE